MFISGSTILYRVRFRWIVKHFRVIFRKSRRNSSLVRSYGCCCSIPLLGNACISITESGRPPSFRAAGTSIPDVRRHRRSRRPREPTPPTFFPGSPHLSSTPAPGARPTFTCLARRASHALQTAFRIARRLQVARGVARTHACSAPGGVATQVQRLVARPYDASGNRLRRRQVSFF